MRRRSFDKVLSVTGFVLAVFLLVLGSLLLWGGIFAQNKVTAELSSQKVSFSSDASALPPDLQQYAGVQVTSGPLAKAYSDLIGVHLNGVAGGKTYSEVSDEWIAGGMTDATLAQERTTLFMGETLRGMLLNAYGYWVFGTIALIGAWVSLAGALVLLILAILGLSHLRKTPETAAVFEPVRV